MGPARPSLNYFLDSIPPENRKRLDEKLTDRRSRATIARSLGGKWQVIADFVPNVHKKDIESIAYNHQNDLQMQQIALLDVWVERNGHLATYHQLAKSLWAADAINSLHILCMELGAPKQPTPAVHAPPTPPQTPPQATSLPSQPIHFPLLAQRTEIEQQLHSERGQLQSQNQIRQVEEIAVAEIDYPFNCHSQPSPVKLPSRHSHQSDHSYHEDIVAQMKSQLEDPQMCLVQQHNSAMKLNEWTLVQETNSANVEREQKNWETELEKLKVKDAVIQHLTEKVEEHQTELERIETAFLQSMDQALSSLQQKLNSSVDNSSLKVETANKAIAQMFEMIHVQHERHTNALHTLIYDLNEVRIVQNTYQQEIELLHSTLDQSQDELTHTKQELKHSLTIKEAEISKLKEMLNNAWKTSRKGDEQLISKQLATTLTSMQEPQSQPHSPPQPTSHHWDTPLPSPLPQLQRGTLHSPPQDISARTISSQATSRESFPQAFSHSLPSRGLRSRGIRDDSEPNPVPLPQNPKGPAAVGFSRMWPIVLICASAILLGLGIQYSNSVMPYNNDSQLQGEKWLNREPLMKLLFHIGYTDSSGKDASFRLIDEIQMHCSELGTQLGIDIQTLKSFESDRRPAAVCRDILDEWKMRGTKTSHPVTWTGLLKAMKNIPQLNRAANLLENALKLHFKEEH